MLPALAIAGVQALGGLAQTIFSGRKKKERDLENYANSYTPNSSIMDYYNKSLARYNANPYQSQSYQNQTNLINRNLATGINATQDRRGGLSTISGLVQGANDASAKAGAMAENQQAQALGQLGSATGMKAGDDRMAFNVNQVQPFERKYNLMAAKASGGNKVMGAGLSNIFGAAQSYDQIKQADKYYNSLNGTDDVKKALWNTRNILGR